MQNLMTICPLPTNNNNSKQFDSTKSPLALLEQTCSRIGADTASNGKASSQSIDHTKKDYQNGHSLNKLNLNGYKPSSLAINQLASLAGNYESGRRSGNSSTEYARASVSPASSLDKTNASYLANLTSNGSRPNSNNGNSSRPNSNNSGTSSLSTKGVKELSKLSYKPYEEANNNEKLSHRKHNSPELEHLKNLNKNEQRKSDNLNGLSSKDLSHCLPNSKPNNNNNLNSAALNYAQQQQLLEAKYLEFQYQQYVAALAAGYPFLPNNNPSLIAAAALSSNQILQQQKNSNISNYHSTSNTNKSNNSVPNVQQQHHQQALSNSHQQNLLQAPSNCPPNCNSCINHNPLLSSFIANTQTPSAVSSSSQNSPLNAAHLAALSAQYPQIPPNFLHLYGLAGYPSALNGLPPLTSSTTPSSSSTSTTTSTSLNHSSLNSLNTLPPNLTNSNPLLNSNNNNSANNKNGPHVCYAITNGQYCNKRFSSAEEYLIHFKSHQANEALQNSNSNANLNPVSLESLYGSYEALLAGANPMANLRRSAMHDSLSSSSRFHPYSKPSANNYSQNSPSSALSAASMLPPSVLNSVANAGLPFPPGLSALTNLNGLNNLANLNNGSNNAAALNAAAAFNMYPYGRMGQPTVQP